MIMIDRSAPASTGEGPLRGHLVPALLSAVLLVLFTLVLFTPACAPAESEGSEEVRAAEARRDGTEAIRAQLRELTRAYLDVDAARADGFAQIGLCRSDTPGATGLRFGHPARIDGRVETLRPEVLLYEPTPDGLALVGVEYFVPFERWAERSPPVLFGQRFQRNEGLRAWTLRAWIWKENPEGLFADRNRRVVCG